MLVEPGDTPSDTAYEVDDDALHVLEKDQRLSASLLWQAQRAFFDRKGVDAWRAPIVPHYVTNNPSLARAYAALVLGFFRDCRAASASPGDPAAPLTIVELGAGSGRFAYLFLRALTELWRASSLAGARFRYVMTDFTESNIAFWRSHRAFEPFLRDGTLEFRGFDVTGDAPIDLSGAGVAPSSAPLVVIANYVFDSIPQDAFTIRGGELHESLISVRSGAPSIDPDAPAPFEGLDIRHSQRPVGLDYYPEPELNDVLREYVERAEDATLLFPSAALRCVHRLAGLSSGQLLLISGDRDEREEAFRRAPGDGAMASHGSFSLLVNHDAVGRYFLRRGGRALRTSHRSSLLEVAAFALGGPPGGHAELERAYADFVERAGPDDFFSLRRAIQPMCDQLTIEQILSFLRLSHHDPRVLRDCSPVLADRLGLATAAQKEEISRAVLRVWDNYFHIGEDHDLAFDIAGLLFAAGAPAAARAMLAESIDLHGDSAGARWNMGLCHLVLGQAEEAVKCFSAAAALAPDFLSTDGWRRKG